MSCCFGKNTDGTDPKKTLSDQSDPLSERPIIPVNKIQNSNIEYSITVKTGDFRNSGTNGPVYVNIFGRDGKQTQDILLSGHDKPFSQGCTRKFQINAVDIGKPQRIIIRHEDNLTGWYVDYIEISVHNFLVRFVANRWLSRSKNDRKLEAELFGSEQPAVIYNVEIQTGDEQIEPLDSPVYMQVYGTTTATPKLFFDSKNPSFTKDSISKFTIASNNVGEIQRIIIGHEGLGKINDWYLKSIKVQMLSQQQEYVINKLLSPTQGDQQLFVELSQNKPRSPSPPVPPKYFVTIQTANVSQKETAENVEMIVRGSDGQIAKILLNDYAKSIDKQLFQQGNLDEFEIEHDDIGNIESITIGFSDTKHKEAWLLEYVDIKYKETVYRFQAQCWLSSRLGPNFSWMTIKPEINDDDLNYNVIVETGESGIDANVILCIYGDENTTTNLALRTTKDGSDAKFDPDSILEFDLKAIDVGKIKKINIGHDGEGSERQWFLKSIQIDKKDEHYTFTANRWLSTEKDDQNTYIDLLVDERKTPPSSPVPKKDQATYTITVVTSSEEDAGTKSGVLMTIFGDKDKTKQFELTNTKQGDKALFESGKTNEFEMELDDVGHINKINIGLDGTDGHPTWHLKSVQIQKGSENYNFSAKKILDQSTPFIDLTPTPARKTPTPEPVKTEKVRSHTPEQKTPPIKETTYKTLICTSSEQKDIINQDANFYIIIYGQKDQTKKLYLKHATIHDKKKLYKKDDKAEFEFKTIDVGKISKIAVGQDDSEDELVWHVDNVTIKRTNETITFNAEQTIGRNSEIELLPSAIPKKTEITYKILIRTGTSQEEGNDSNLYIIIYGKNGQTKKMLLNETTKTNKNTSLKKNDKIEYEFKIDDVGKISKIVLSQNPNEETLMWDIDNITIKRHNETTTFNVDRKIEKDDEVELIPSPILKKSETPRKTSKTADTISKLVTKTKDTDYEIITSTGEQTLEASITLNIRGENGIVRIPLTQTKTGEKPFQSKSTNEFTCRTTDVGKIRRIIIEHNGTDKNMVWHLKTIQIKKGHETYNFNADLRLDYKENKANLYPVGALFGHQREDYVQSELRRLRESLRSESSKLHPPVHKAYEPFVYNDLRPYFDTSSVERAIYSPLEAPPGYYTRLTALRIVEPWETYGMDYGVNYEILKQRKGRSFSTRRAKTMTQSGIMIVPPISLPYGGHITHINTAELERTLQERSRSSKHRSLSRHNNNNNNNNNNNHYQETQTDGSIDRKQGSTHLPKFPCVNMRKPAEYSRPLTMNDVPKIRTFIRSRYTTEAHTQMEKDYKRTHDDLYRMQLDDMDSYHESNRDNMLHVYHSYLENTPGSKKALRELCDRIGPLNTKSSVDTKV
ncbi:unnamed protein product [Rotaria sp. Silwood1]|nr:unnamed protein product [Rotaria sp. Silwood1]CAF1172143.1 unnamed protein product [Rotaria sp. Silwood1]